MLLLQWPHHHPDRLDGVLHLDTYLTAILGDVLPPHLNPSHPVLLIAHLA